MSLAECVCLQEEQDIKALQMKNRKLGEALDQRQVRVSLSYTQNCDH